jgi:hypothetical protein
MTEESGFHSGQGQEIPLFSITASLLYNGHRGLFPKRKSGQGLKLSNHFHLVPRPKLVEIYLYSPIRLHGAVLN